MSAEAVVAEETVTPPPAKKKKAWGFPSAFTILFILTIVAAAATWMIPAGS